MANGILAEFPGFETFGIFINRTHKFELYRLGRYGSDTYSQTTKKNYLNCFLSVMCSNKNRNFKTLSWIDHLI